MFFSFYWYCNLPQHKNICGILLSFLGRRSKPTSQSSDTHKSTKKVLLNFDGPEKNANANIHNSDKPVDDCTEERADHILNCGNRDLELSEEGADHMQAQSPAKLSLRKALFDTQDER